MHVAVGAVVVSLCVLLYECVPFHWFVCLALLTMFVRAHVCYLHNRLCTHLSACVCLCVCMCVCVCVCVCVCTHSSDICRATCRSHLIMLRMFTISLVLIRHAMESLSF